MIDAERLGKVYAEGHTRALADFDLSCTAGQVVGLLGPNGAGKTTALRILSTAIAATTGRARVAGYDVRTEPEQVRQHVGFLSGDTGLYARFTPREIIAFFAHLYGLRGRIIGERTARLAELLELGPFLDQRCKGLSTGQRQRVSLARTLVHDPPVLILDEPTSGLDVLASRSIVEFIHRCRSDGRAVIFSTHILSEAERLCDSVVLLHRGRAIFRGTTAEVRAKTNTGTLEEAFLSLIGAEV